MSAQVSEMDFSSAALARPDTEGAADRAIKIVVRNLNFYYGTLRALTDISIDIQERIVTAFIGPSGCGKSTFLRTLNRMNRSEEHTSELQSQSNLVCRLLLEKKKKTKTRK